MRSTTPSRARRRRRAAWSAGALLPAAMLAAVALVAPAAGASASYAPVADSYVDSSRPTANFGSSSQVRADGSPQVTSYLRFAPVAGPVARAVLRVYVNVTHKTGYRVHPVADATWGEDAITASNAPAFGGAAAESGPAPEGWTEVDVTPLVQAGAPVSLALTTTSGTALSMASREAGSARAPRLVVETGDGAPGDTTPPAAPGGVRAEADSPTRVTITWNPVGDADLAGYRVDRDGTQVASTGGATSAVDDGVEPATTYSYAVRAIDEAGNLSAPSAPATVTTPGAPPGGGEETLAPAADAYVDPGKPGTNYGASAQLRADGSPQVTSYLRFAPVAGPVARAVLRVYVNVTHKTGYRVHPVADATWGEDAITASNAPAFGGAAAESGPAPEGWTEVDVTPLVDGDGPVSLALTTTSSTALSMASREAGAAKAPRLVVETGVGGGPGDTTPPAPPAAIWASGVTATQAVVRWRPSPSADVAAYEVLRDGATVASLALTGFTDSGLARDTAHTYRVVAVDRAGNRSQPSAAATVRTKDTTADPVIAAAGDIACDPKFSAYNDGNGGATACKQKVVSDLLLGTDWAAVLPLGDNQYYCASLQAFQAAYEPSWGRFKAVSQPIAGNHEYVPDNEGRSDVTGCADNVGAPGHYAYFGAAAGTPGQGWYSYDIGEWHLIALNSECDWVGGCTASSPQGRWLAADLAAHPNRCTLAYFHEPLFTSGRLAEPDIKPFWDQLYAAGVDVILNGHDHIYERFAPQRPSGAADAANGIRQFTVGTGGANHTQITTAAPNSQVRNASTFGILKMTLRDGGYDWTFVPEPGKSFSDAGTGTCH